MTKCKIIKYLQANERTAVRYFFKRGEMVRYGIMAEKYESESRKENVFCFFC